MPLDSKVGPSAKYSKAPFESNVKRSVPPAVLGGTDRREGNGPQGTGGKSSRYAGLNQKLRKDLGRC